MKQAIIRLSVLLILLINQTLILFGYEPLPFTDEQIYDAVSSVALVVVALYTTYFNNDFTKEAERGTELTRKLKDKKKGE